MKDRNEFINKELSWLAFNERVIQEAADLSVPIINRIHFLGIYSANMDEFFRVHVADIHRKALLEIAQNPEQNTEQSKWSLLLEKIIQKVDNSSEQMKTLCQQTFTELSQHHIKLIFNDENAYSFNDVLSTEQIQWLKQYFDHKIIRHITPIIIQSNTHFSECLDDDAIYFLVSLNDQNTKQYCLVEIPREEVTRFIVLPKSLKNNDNNKTVTQYIVMLDDVVRYFIEHLFIGVFSFDKIEAHSMKLTRDAEYNLTNELDESLLNLISKSLKQRLKADLVRLVYEQNMPNHMLKFLKKALKVKELDNFVPGGSYRHFKDFISFPNLGDKRLEKAEINALDSYAFNQQPSVFSAISKQDILLYYPYHKFKHFTEFIRQAAYDPNVRQIKINIYRVAKNSLIIHSLTEAVKNGKQVTVVVELRARFDEQANIDWAKMMKDAGIHVEFGIKSLKIHSKLCLITRIEDEKNVHYAHIGTGNFHEKNARIYTDFALFTKNKDICQEVDNVFSFITHSYKRFRFNHLIVSPLTSRRRLYQLIDNEILSCEQGKKGRITLKLNNLVDKGLINRLYSANDAGVTIRLIIRGMCSLIPNTKGLSENIKAISIVDQFLEHPRVMVFGNSGDPLVYISSADWMERNIDQRVEVACPIYDNTLKKRIIHILNLHFKDNVKARIINKSQNNRYVVKGNNPVLRSQEAIYNFLQQEELNIQQNSEKDLLP